MLGTSYPPKSIKINDCYCSHFLFFPWLFFISLLLSHSFTRALFLFKPLRSVSVKNEVQRFQQILIEFISEPIKIISAELFYVDFTLLQSQVNRIRFNWRCRKMSSYCKRANPRLIVFVAFEKKVKRTKPSQFIVYRWQHFYLLIQKYRLYFNVEWEMIETNFMY